MMLGEHAHSTVVSPPVVRLPTRVLNSGSHKKDPSLCVPLKQCLFSTFKAMPSGCLST
uniref:Uncharacterized protein n=1 Tax=Arundo donax TaxID=35708 RepID=A0A0A9HJI1_ARUDO